MHLMVMVGPSTLNGAAVPGFVDARNKSGHDVGGIVNRLYEAER